MRDMRELFLEAFRKRIVLAYLAIYFLFLLLLRTFEGTDVTEPILILLIVGIGFSILAWWLTEGLRRASFSVKSPVAECSLLVLVLLVLVGFLTWGIGNLERTVSSDPARSLVILAAKLALFVMLPLLLFRGLWKYTIRDLVGVPADWRGHARVTFWMATVLIAFQLLFGQGLSRIREAKVEAWELAVGILPAFLWLVVEVGLVEEFFFRALVQSRVAALGRSEAVGIVVTVLLFGLAHAPGLYFRTHQTLEAVGTSPSWLMAIGYAITVVSVSGFFLGVLWARTRNLVVLMLVHAAADLVPNLATILRGWHPK